MRNIILSQFLVRETIIDEYLHMQSFRVFISNVTKPIRRYLPALIPTCRRHQSLVYPASAELHYEHSDRFSGADYLLVVIQRLRNDTLSVDCSSS
jgi:hypothetical protein